MSSLVVVQLTAEGAMDRHTHVLVLLISMALVYVTEMEGHICSYPGPT